MVEVIEVGGIWWWWCFLLCGIFPFRVFFFFFFVVLFVFSLLLLNTPTTTNATQLPSPRHRNPTDEHRPRRSAQKQLWPGSDVIQPRHQDGMQMKASTLGGCDWLAKYHVTSSGCSRVLHLTVRERVWERYIERKRVNGKCYRKREQRWKMKNGEMNRRVKQRLGGRWRTDILRKRTEKRKNESRQREIVEKKKTKTNK